MLSRKGITVISMKKQLLPFLITIALIATTTLADARALPPLEGLELARRAFAGVTDFSAEITQEKQIALLKRKLTSTGLVRFRKPDTFYMEINPPHASRLLLRDTVLTMNLPAEEVRQRIVLPPEESLLRWFTYLDRPIAQLPEGVDVRAEQKGDQVTLRITPRTKGGVRELQLALDKGDLKRLVIEEQNRDRTVITFHRIRKNTGLSDKDFRVE